MKIFHYILVSILLCFTVQMVSAQEEGLPSKAKPHRSKRSSKTLALDSVPAVKFDTAAVLLTKADSTSLVKMQKKVAKQKRDWTTWTPEPQRALWLALVLPGAGQIYNRKFWKLPIVYGGFIGCAYAMRWNNQMYNDYSRAYNDLMDNDPNTASYTEFLHLGTKITTANAARYQTIFKNRKDTYRRWRDLSLFIMLGVYAISVIDAYVDASLSKFDISDDLSMRIEPALINTGTGYLDASSPGDAILKQNALGVHGTITF